MAERDENHAMEIHKEVGHYTAHQRLAQFRNIRMNRLAVLPVLAAGLYLIGLGVVALLRPDRARRFLESHASSARTHFVELALRMMVGGGFVLAAEQLKWPAAFRVFGWVLVGTTIFLAAVPWTLHRRFAEWSVPQATRRISLVGVGSLAGGALVLYAALAPGVPV
jgi:hypothetical protein